MNSITKLFSIFVVFIQIQIALSQGVSTIHQLCKANVNPNLCFATLNYDPRSKTANYEGLALISADATSKKVNQMLEYLISARKNIKNPKDVTRYDACIQAYGTAAHKLIPAVYVDLKASNFAQANDDLNSVVSVPGKCEAQFAGSSPLTGRNNVVHDVAAVSADILRYLHGNK